MWRQAGGNPFYLKELTRALDADSRRGGVTGNALNLPETVIGVVGRRLGVLDGPSRRVLAAAAVVDAEFDIGDLSDIVELPVSAVQERLRPAYEAGLIDDVPARPGAYRFSHGLLREAVLAQLPAAEGTSVHAAIAATRAAGLATAAYEHGIATADHAWRAGAEISPDIALEVHETVIQRALNRSAYDDVIGLAEHALHICRRLPAKPEHLERQATMWLHLAGAKGILEGQAITTAAEAVQRAFEIGCEVRGHSYYGAIALQCLMLCAHGRTAEAEVIAGGLREQYERSGDPDVGLVSDFAHVGVYALRGRRRRGHQDRPAHDGHLSGSRNRHRSNAFLPSSGVTAGWRSARRSVAIETRCVTMRSGRFISPGGRGDVFNVIAAKLVLVESAASIGDVVGTAAAADAVAREFDAAGGHQWGGAARIISVWAQILETGEGEPQAAFDAFDVLTADGTCAMNSMFLALLADIETRCGRDEHARELLIRAQALADSTGEHAWDDVIARRLEAAPRSPLARTVGQRRAPLTPHRPVGHQVQHVVEAAGIDQRH